LSLTLSPPPSRASLTSATARAALWLWLSVLIGDAMLGCSMVELGQTETDTSAHEVFVSDTSPPPRAVGCVLEFACVLGDPSLLVRTQSNTTEGLEPCTVSTQACPVGTVCGYPNADEETCTPNQAACLPLAETCRGRQDNPCPAGEYCDFTAFACGADALFDCATNPQGPNTCTYAEQGGYGVCRARPTSCPVDNEPTVGCDGVEYTNPCQRRAAGASSEQCFPTGVTFGPSALPPANFCPGYTTMESDTATLRGGVSANLGAGNAWSESGTHRLVLGARPHLRGVL